jgi:hypothetical protein
MNTLRDVKEKVRTLLDDPQGDFATDDYVLPFVNLVYEDCINYLANTCSPFMTEQRLVLNLPQGTTDLTSYQVAPTTGAIAAGFTGSPLLGIRKVLKIWWKQAGQPENCYCEANESKNLPNVTPQNYITGQQVFWEWREYKIFLTPLSFNADFKVKGEFAPPPLLKDADAVQIYPSMSSALAYMVAATIGVTRVNQTYLTMWQQRATSTLDDISADLVRGEQGTSQRVGRVSRSRRSYGYGGYGG